MTVKILGISGSPRNGATKFCVQEALKVAGEIADVEIELINLAGKKINNCIHCDQCLREGEGHCPVFEDDMNDLLPIVQRADGFIIGSPVYQMNTSGILQNFLNRFRPIGVHTKGAKRYIRVTGAIACGGMRNGGVESTLTAINNFALASGMTVVSGGTAAYNGAAVWSNDRKAAGVQEDTSGLASVRVMARRVAIMTKLLKLGYNNLKNEIPDHLLAGFGDQMEMFEFYQQFSQRE